MHEAVSHVRKRLNCSEDQILALALRLDTKSVLAMIDYIEYRCSAMRGDENPQSELQQMRKDLSSCVMWKILSQNPNKES